MECMASPSADGFGVRDRGADALFLSTCQRETAPITPSFQLQLPHDLKRSMLTVGFTLSDQDSNWQLSKPVILQLRKMQRREGLYASNARGIEAFMWTRRLGRMAHQAPLLLLCLACLLQPGTPQKECSQGHYADPGYSAVGKLADIMRPSGIALTPDSSTIVVADSDNHQILAVDSATSDVTTLAGSATSGSQDCVGTDARFNRPFSVAITPDGSSIIVADGDNHMLRQIFRSTRAVTTLAGSTTSGSQDGMVRDREKEGGVRSRTPANATIECTRGFLRPCRF
jgi:hypothetical protein